MQNNSKIENHIISVVSETLEKEHYEPRMFQVYKILVPDELIEFMTFDDRNHFKVWRDVVDGKEEISFGYIDGAKECIGSSIKEAIEGGRHAKN